MEESGLHLDANNEAQCAHFSSYEMNPKTGYQIEAGQLKKVAAILLNVDKIDINVESDKTADKFLNIDYQGEITQENNQAVLQKILDHYNLKILKTLENSEFWVLNIQNKKKLDAHISDLGMDYDSSLQFENNHITLKNGSMKILASQFQNTYGERFLYPGTDKKTYDLEFELQDNLRATAEFLEKKYGIAFKNTQREITRYTVVDKT